MLLPRTWGESPCPPSKVTLRLLLTATGPAILVELASEPVEDELELGMFEEGLLLESEEVEDSFTTSRGFTVCTFFGVTSVELELYPEPEQLRDDGDFLGVDESFLRFFSGSSHGAETTWNIRR